MNLSRVPDQIEDIENLPESLEAAQSASASVASDLSAHKSAANPHGITPGLISAAPATHGHAEGEITNLSTDLAAKANTSDVTTALEGKANTSHTQALSSITDAGTMASQNANGVNVTGGSVTGLAAFSSTGISTSNAAAFSVIYDPTASYNGATPTTQWQLVDDGARQPNNPDPGESIGLNPTYGNPAQTNTLHLTPTTTPPGLFTTITIWAYLTGSTGGAPPSPLSWNGTFAVQGSSPVSNLTASYVANAYSFGAWYSATFTLPTPTTIDRIVGDFTLQINGASGGGGGGVFAVYAVASGGPLLGFYGAAGVTKQTITGSRGGNAALASLLTFLAARGDIVDATTT